MRDNILLFYEGRLSDILLWKDLWPSLRKPFCPSPERPSGLLRRDLLVLSNVLVFSLLRLSLLLYERWYSAILWGKTFRYSMRDKTYCSLMRRASDLHSKDLPSFYQKTFFYCLLSFSAKAFSSSMRKVADLLCGDPLENLLWEDILASLRKPSYLLLKELLAFIGKNFCSSVGKPLLILYERRPFGLLWETTTCSSMREDLLVLHETRLFCMRELPRHLCEWSSARKP